MPNQCGHSHVRGGPSGGPKHFHGPPLAAVEDGELHRAPARSERLIAVLSHAHGLAAVSEGARNGRKWRDNRLVPEVNLHEQSAQHEPIGLRAVFHGHKHEALCVHEEQVSDNEVLVAQE